jgi:hypothetical protein
MPEHIQKRKDKSPTPEYREGWDRIWGKKKKKGSKKSEKV